MRFGVLALCLVLVGTLAAAQPGIEPIVEALDPVVGQTVPPALAAIYNATGQNITREDVRMSFELNVTKGDVNVFGLLIGSGRAEVQADVHLRVEMRVISSDRIRELFEDGSNSSGNASALSDVYLTSEMFRATATAELVAAFQARQEAALAEYLANAVPELDVLGLTVQWSHTSPFETVRDLSLTEPPITLDIDATVQYLRTESVPSLLSSYLDKRDKPEDPKKAYAKQLKKENGDPLRTRDFFAAAAYTQLLNLSMEPGWSLNVTLQLPRGYSFTYFNENVDQVTPRRIEFAVDALESDAEVQEVLLASITHKRFVALLLCGVTLVVGLLLALPGRFLYQRYRLPKLASKPRP
jgi:hypothetical protein